METKLTNEEFEKLSPEEKRVAIAKDVIKSLTAKKINAKSWTYVHLKETNILEYPEDTEIQDLVEEKVCEVCAFGALFTSTARLFDKLKIKDLEGTNTEGTYYGAISTIDFKDVQHYLRIYFEPIQLMMIEVAFEGRDPINYSNVLGQDLYVRCCDFLRDRKEDLYTRRMVKIMENIIQNNGTFIVDPSQE